LHRFILEVVALSREFKDQLQELLGEYEKQLEQKRREERERERRGREYLKEFRQVYNQSILPVFKRAKRITEKSGHRAELHEPDFSRAYDTEARLALYPAHHDPAEYTPENTPYIRFVAHTGLQLVTVDIGVASPAVPEAAGPRETIELEELTLSAVEKYVLELFREAFAVGRRRQRTQRDS
jgi:sugar-specific transcriptional regulator TrmB